MWLLVTILKTRLRENFLTFLVLLVMLGFCCISVDTRCCDIRRYKLEVCVWSNRQWILSMERTSPQVASPGELARESVSQPRVPCETDDEIAKEKDTMNFTYTLPSDCTECSPAWGAG